MEKEIKKNENLEKFAINITNKALNGEIEKIFGREKELDEMCKILSRKKKNNVIMVGYPGTGKTEMAFFLAQRIVNQKVPYGLLNKVIYSIDSASITAGTQYRGQMEERLKKILQESEDDDRVILFIDEIHTILDNGSANSLNIANIMKPHLTSGRLQVIGATTFDEYKKFFEKDGALSRRFNKLVIDEPSEEACVEILKKCISSYEEFHSVKFTDEILYKIPSIAKKYIKDRYLPDSAIDIIDELGAKLKVEKTKPSNKLLKMLDDMEDVQKKKFELIKDEKWTEIAYFKPNVLDKLKDKILTEQETYMNKILNIDKTEITYEDLLSVVSQISKVPLDKLNKDGKENVKKLEDILNKELINQDDAKNKVLKALKKRVLNLNNPNKPISYLFLGKSGSGKSFISKLIAEYWFNSSLIRFDMGEFQEKFSSSTLIGSAPGYVGYEDGGNLTEQVRRNPYSLILFDEIEKANKDILNILLTILDEGYCSDAKGRKVDFKNCIIVMTSNLGAKDSQYKKPSYGGGQNVNLEDTSIEAAKKHFTPELWNRIDEIVVFNSLQKEDMFKILEIEIEKFKKILKNKNISIFINKKVKDFLVDKGFDANLGARPLKRAFESLLVDEIVNVLISQDDVKKLNINMNSDNTKIIVEV